MISVEFAFSVTIFSMLTPVVIRVAAIPNNRMIVSKSFRPFPVMCHISLRWNSGGIIKATTAAAKPTDYRNNNSYILLLRLSAKYKQ